MADFDNLIEAEDLIVQRLKDKVPALKAVQTARDLEGVTERNQIAPAAHILYGGYQVLETQADGLRSTIELTWDIVIVTKHITEAREQAGPLMAAVMEALAGWSPRKGVYRGMHLTRSSYRPTYRPGFAYLPLAFTTRIVLLGTGD